MDVGKKSCFASLVNASPTVSTENCVELYADFAGAVRQSIDRVWSKRHQSSRSHWNLSNATPLRSVLDSRMTRDWKNVRFVVIISFPEAERRHYWTMRSALMDFRGTDPNPIRGKLLRSPDKQI